MFNLQDLYSQIGQLGIPGYQPGQFGLQDMSGLGSQQILEAMANMYGIEDPSVLSPQMFQPFSLQSLMGTMGKTYSPLMQNIGKAKSAELLTAMDSKKTKQAAGGFAGSGAYKKHAKGVHDVYGASMTDVVTDIGRRKAESLSGLEDLYQSWGEQVQSFVS
tara:strand:- start:404 stop:886 length:483 start_codon:yes stop_codon:yes gene_type:complete